MTTEEIIAQVVAFITCMVACSSYFAKNKFLYLMLQTLVNLLFGVQYFLLGATSGLVSNAVSVAKYIYIIIKEKYGKQINNVELVAFMIISVVVGAFAVEGWLDLIPIINSVIFTYAVCQNNKLVLRYIVAFVCALWIVYGIFVGAYVSAVYSFAEMIFALVTIIKIKRGEKNEQTSDN